MGEMMRMFEEAMARRRAEGFKDASKPVLMTPVVVEAPMVKEPAKAPEKAVSVVPVASVDDGWDAVEEVSVEDEQDEYWK